MSFEKSKLQPRTMPKEDFFTKAQLLTEDELRKLGAEGREKKSSLENINSFLSTSFQNPETGLEKKISFDIEKEIAFFEEIYQKNLGINLDKEEIILIWKENYAEIKSEIEKVGYDSILIIPDNFPEEEILNQKLIETMEDVVDSQKKKIAATYQDSNFTDGGSFAGVKNAEKPKYRIVLNHSEQNIYNNPNANPFLKATLGKDIMSLSGLDQSEVDQKIMVNQEIPVNFEVEINGQKIKVQSEGQNLAEYMILQRSFFEKAGKHLDESGWTWLIKSRSGSRVVYSSWGPDSRQLNVFASDPDNAGDDLGLRLSRSFSRLT